MEEKTLKTYVKGMEYVISDECAGCAANGAAREGLVEMFWTTVILRQKCSVPHTGRMFRPYRSDMHVMIFSS